MRAGIIARNWCELFEERTVRTDTGATKTELVSLGKVRCYEVQSRPYTYWQENRASERFVGWQVQLIFRHQPHHKWDRRNIRIRYNGDLYRLMWYNVSMGQTKVLLRMENE